MPELTVKYNELTAAQFIELWKTVWGNAPTLEQGDESIHSLIFQMCHQGSGVHKNAEKKRKRLEK